MFIKTNIKLMVIISLVLSNSLWASGSKISDARSLWNEASVDSNNLKSFNQAGDINDLKKDADALDKKWFQKDKELYASMMLSTAVAFSSPQFGDSGLELMRKYTKMTLDKLNNLPDGNAVSLQMEFNLLHFVQHSLGESKHFQNLSKSKDWPEQRREVLKYYLHGWERLEKNIDPNWNKNGTSKPAGPIRPPTTGGMGMVSPESIADPKLRADYEAELNKHWELQRKYNEQYEIRSIERSDLPTIQRFILEMYSGPTFESKNLEVEALTEDIAKFVKDEKIRATILEGMKNRLTEELKPKPDPRQGHIPPTRGTTILIR